MKHKNHLRCGLLASLTSLSTLLLAPTFAQAQDAPAIKPANAPQADAPRNILWLIQPGQGVQSGDSTSILAVVVLKRLLEGTAGQHTVAATPEHLAPRVAASQRPELPPCLSGLQPCPNPHAAALDALDADLLLTARLDAAPEAFALHVEMRGPNGANTLTRTFTQPLEKRTPEQAMEALAAQVIREIFNLSGTVEVRSDPDGARILIDGQPAGTAPLTVELEVGPHTLTAQLDGFDDATREIRVTPGRRATATLPLTTRDATLTVQTTPAADAEVLIDGQLRGKTGEPLPLPPGTYQLEVRGQGYAPRTLSVTLDSAEPKLVSLTLESARPTLELTGLGEINTDAILARRFYARINYQYAALTSGLEETSGRLAGRDVTVVREEVNDGVIPVRPEFSYHGLNLDLGYSWEQWGLIALGVSWLGASETLEVRLDDGEGQLQGELSNFSRLELRPLQLTWRQAYKNLIPSVRGGFAWAHTSVDVASPRGASTLTRDDLLFNFSIDISYFFDSWWFAWASIGVQWDLTHDDTNAEQMFGAGVGMTFEDPLQELFGSAPANPPKAQ